MTSAGALCFEVSLTRLFAVQQFHHFAFVVVSLAVMGNAASGILLVLRPRWASRMLLSAIFALAVCASYLTINFLPFDSYSIAWDRRQAWILILYFLTASLPFLFAGWVTAACLADFRGVSHQMYAANLIGSGAGCLLALGALSISGGEGAVWVSAATGLMGAGLFAPRNWQRLTLAVLAAGGLALAAKPPDSLRLSLSPQKPLALAVLAPEARHALVRWSASTRLDVVEGAATHIFPDLSMVARVELPRQAALYLDGEGPIPVTSLSPEDPTASALAAHMPFYLVYLLRPEANALIVQSGAGLDAVLALAAGASHVTLTQDEPLVTEILTGPYSDLSQRLFTHPSVSLTQRSSRGALQDATSSYDVVHFALSDAYRPVTSGAFSLTENYILTLEAFTAALDRLTEDGLLVITRWLGNPPSEESRVWSIVLAALDQKGVPEPFRHLAAFRGLRTATIVVSRLPFRSGELSAIREFLDANEFDPIFLPDLVQSELNRYNRLPTDRYYEQFTALLADRRKAVASATFNLDPPTDDRPFFFHFFRWRQTPQVLAMIGQTWQPFGGSGYLVLLALLATVSMIAIPLAAAPWFVLRRNRSWTPPGIPAAAYFACLGAGFMLVEVSLIQRLTLLLDRPVLSLATVLFTLLIASGIGSALSPRLPHRLSLASLAILLLLFSVGIPPLVRWALPFTSSARLALSGVLLTIPGILMGAPFAAGLRQMEKISPGSTTWAWAINGAMSGVAGVLAAMASLDLGLSATMALGALAYFGAWLASRLSGW